MRGGYAAPPAGDGGGPPTSLESQSAGPNSAAGAQESSRGNGYSNLGLQIPDGNGGGPHDEGGGLVPAMGRGRRKKMSYVGLDGDGGEETPSQSSDGGEEAGGGGEEADKVSGRLAIFGLLNLGYVGLQLAGAMAFGSLALMSDGFHNLSDVAAIGMAMYIHRLQRRKCPENSEGGTDELPFGYKRAEVIGGLMNSVALVSLSAYIILSAIPRLFVPAEVKQGLPYIFLAFGGVCVNLVGVLFFMYAGEDAQCPHGGGFLAAHSHSHDHGHEVPVELDSLGLLTLVDPFDVAAKSALTSFAGDDGRADNHHHDSDHEISVVLAGPDPIGRVSLANTTAARDAAYLSSRRRKGGGVAVSGDEEGHRGAWVGGGGGHACSHSHAGGGCSHGHGHEESGCCDGDGHGHDHAEEGLSLSRHSGGTEPCSSSSTGSGGGGGCGGQGVGEAHSHDHGHEHHANGHACSNGGHGSKNGVEMTKKHGGACGGGREAHGHHGGHSGGGGGGCSHVHEHGHGAGAQGGGCGGHGGGSMNLMAVLVHAIADAVSSGVVCAQGIVAFIFGRSGVDWTDYLDPLTSIALSVFIVYCALPVIKECSHVLLEGTPRSADLPRLRKELLKIRGVSSIQSLSVTQLNSEETFVASVTVVAAINSGSTSTAESREIKGRGRGAREEVAPGNWASTTSSLSAVAESVRRVLAGHNIGRNTVEIVSPAVAAGVREGDTGRAFAGGVDGPSANGDGGGWIEDTGQQLSPAIARDSGGDRVAETGGEGALEEGGSGGSGGNSHGGHSHGHGHGHGHCSGHGHSHDHASTVDLV